MADREIEYGIIPFLDQLIKTLQIEQTDDPVRSQEVSGSAGGKDSSGSEVGEVAAQHGRELYQHGFILEQVVHNYGNLCQAIMNLAVEKNVAIEANEYRTLNRCIDNATAEAVTAFNFQAKANNSEQQTLALNERLGVLAHELRNLIQTATIAFSIIKEGHVPLNGATGGVLERSLIGLTNLIDRSLAEVRIGSELPPQLQIFSLDDFINEVKISASLEANVRNCILIVSPVDKELTLNADRALLFAAVGNLLQNAFKFTHRGTQVTLRAYAVDDRVLIEVEDQGDGLPPGQAEKMFLPFTQAGEDRTGLGLGLSIVKRSVEVNDGILHARNLPNSGCVFTLDLPRPLLSQQVSS